MCNYSRLFQTLYFFIVFFCQSKVFLERVPDLDTLLSTATFSLSSFATFIWEI